MSKTVNSIRGMHDILPEHNGAWHFLEEKIRQLMAAYSYAEIRTPIIEKTELFCRSIGEVTDIVEKEMYTFTDRNGDSLSLRPENTASCVRAGIEHGLLYNTIQRLWYTGPMFRHERPQKGRYRQFHQVGAEVFGIAGPYIEVELILISARLWRMLGIDNAVTLQINTLGDLEDRGRYREGLVAYFKENKEQLDEDSLRRLETNPLRILDTKNPAMQKLVEEAPKLMDVLSDESREHFHTLTSVLDDNAIRYSVNHRLVRGLDYYSHTVFEWVTDELGAQGTVCAGGRYDGLIEQLGGKPTPGAGWAMGVERLLALIEAKYGAISAPALHGYLVLNGEQARAHGLVLSENLRNRVDGLRLQVDCGGGSLKSQFKRADRSGATYALVIGDDELDANVVSVKPLRGGGEQQMLDQTALCEMLNALLLNETTN